MNKIVNSKDFVEKFRELERVIRDELSTNTNGSPVMVYEEKLAKIDPDKANYLTHLRQKRNVIVHNDTYSDNVAVTDFDIKFLESLIYDINSINGTVKDFYTQFRSLPVVTEDETLIDAIRQVNKVKRDNVFYVLNKDKTEIGTMNATDILATIAGGKKTSVKIKSLDIIRRNLEVIKSDLPMSDIEKLEIKRPVAVMSRNKIVGILF